jgi:hypothetical protein
MGSARRRGMVAATGGLLAAVSVAAGATAASKPSSGFYVQLKGNPPATVVSFSLKGTKLYDFTHFDRCVADMIQTPVVTRMQGQSFSFHKVVTAEGGKGKYDLSFTGRFTSATVAKGTATYHKTKGDQLGPAGCRSTVHFTVKRDGTPRPPNLGS